MSPSLKSLIISWLEFLEKGRDVSSHTLGAYRIDLQGFISFFAAEGEKALSLEDFAALKLREIRAWISHRHQRGLTARSTARAVSAVKSFARFLIEGKHIQSHVIDTYQAPRIKKSIPRPLSVAQTLNLLDQIPVLGEDPFIGLRDKALFTLVYSVGLRISEALSLNWGDICGNSLQILGKGKKFRQVPLIDEAKKIIEEYKRVCPFEPQDKTPLFLGERGGRLNPGVAQKQMRHYRNMLGLPDSLTPHALRHSCATHLIESSGELRTVQELLGHESLSTTQQYTEINKNHLMNVYAKANPRGK
jgi:integrase/recombinase XerC